MPDSRVTVPIEDFAQTMRSLFPRYALLSDERLIESFASENPQCRLLREGLYISLENLSSLFAAEAERQAEGATPRSEPAPAAASSPAIVDNAVESAESQQDGIVSRETETVSPGGAIIEPPMQSAASDSELSLLTPEVQEEKNRRVVPWVFAGVAALALAASGIYYAQHSTVENPNNKPPVQVAPVPDASAPAPTSPTTVPAPQPEPEHHTEIAPTVPPAAVKTEPNISLPTLNVDQLFQRFHAQNGEGSFIDKRIRIRAKIEKLGPNEVSFVGHDGSSTYWFDIRGFVDNALNSLAAGDDVDVLCAYTGNRASTGDTVIRWSFHGFSIRKVSAK